MNISEFNEYYSVKLTTWWLTLWVVEFDVRTYKNIV